MKTYVIASSEYRANMPDLFLMDETGKYYGVSSSSYVIFDKFPKSIEHWENREGSDAGRRFVIDCVDLAEELVQKFEALTLEYERLDAERPLFTEQYPSWTDGVWKTKKAYKQACDDYQARYMEHHKANNVASYMRKMDEVWSERTKLFATFSEKVYQAVKYHECFK